MNPKIVRLLHEGFSINTLENLSENQLNILYKKITKEQKGSVRIPSDKADPAKIKTLTDQGINVEMGEGEEENVTDVNKGEDDQDPIQKQGPDGMGEGYISEKSVSRQQQKIMGLALSVKKGDTPKSKVSKKVQKMAKEMSKKDLTDFAKTKHKGLPKTVEEMEIEKLEEGILRIVQNHLPPHTTKSELLNYINRNL